MAALIGALRVSLSADTAAFQSGMKRAERQARTSSGAIQKSIGGIKAGVAGLAAGLSIGLLTNVIKQALDYAGSLGEISQQLGVTTRDLQVFRFAAGQVGIGQAELEKGLGKLTITLGQVAAGAKAPAKALDAIGISAKQLQGLDTGQAFRLIADGLEKIPDRAQRAAVEVALFGRAGAKLDNLLSGGSRAINELELAADRLGIVLSDEQIQRADETADKLEAVKTVLMARIAGVVADNSTAILDLASSLGQVASDALAAAAAMSALANSAPAWAKRIAEAASLALNPIGAIAGVIADSQRGKLSSSATVKLGPPKPFKPAGGQVKQFLASGGGGGKGRKTSKGPRDTGLQDAFRFDEDLRRAQMDVLRAQQDLAGDYVARHIIAIAILDLERAGQKAQLEYEVASGEKTKAQAAQVDALQEQESSLKRQAELADVETQRREEYAELEKTVMEVGLDKLRSEEQLAETASEARDVRLRILDYQYRMERAILEAVLADEKSSELAKNQARQRLAGLNATQVNDRQGVINSTRGPMEDWLASLPTTTAKAQEALERLQVEGFEGLIDAAVALSEGFDNAKDVLLNTLKQFLQGLLRMELQKGLGGLLGSGGALGGLLNGVGSIFGGGRAGAAFAGAGAIDFSSGAVTSFVPELGFAGGGGFTVRGIPGIDKNILSMNGLPIANVTYGERVSVSNDNPQSSAGGRALVQNFTFPNSDFDSFRRSERQVARAAKRRLAV